MLRVFLAVVVLIQSSFVLADAEGEIAYRKGVMKVVGGHMSAMGAILRKGVHTDDLGYHADGMADIAAIAPNVFPAGSGEGKTDSLPAIWEQPEAFKVAMDKFVAAADGMSAAVDSGDRSKIGPAIKALGGSCKGCHDDFKAD